MKKLVEIRIPDLGNTPSSTIIEIAVQVGNQVNVGDCLITLESEKASMDFPSPKAGIVKALRAEVNQSVSTGDVVLVLETEEASTSEVQTASESLTTASDPVKTIEIDKTPVSSAVTKGAVQATPVLNEQRCHASPGIRRLARELEISLEQVSGSGPKGRILKEDLRALIQPSNAKTTFALPLAPEVDFSQFGPTETQPLSKIKRLSAEFLHRNWLLAPHVTQFDEADITELETFRKAQQSKFSTAKHTEKQSIKLTPLAFIMKAVVIALKRFPQFNASLNPNNSALILKQYYHIGFAVDTPEGLVVPVITSVDQKSLFELAQEISVRSEEARAGRIDIKTMQSHSFTISSLGGMGGGPFTPIINLPDVAILGVSKASIKPAYQEGQFIPRMLLPISLSYDHRAIDGAEGTRFMQYLVSCLNDIRQWLL